jgi:hypothetical protein
MAILVTEEDIASSFEEFLFNDLFFFLRLLVAQGQGYSCQPISSALFSGSLSQKPTREKRLGLI